MNLQLETGEAGRPTRCECCHRGSQTVHGFLYRDGDAYGIYYAGWSEGHPDRGVTMAVAVGDWDELPDESPDEPNSESGASRRLLIGLAARPTASEIQFAVLEPEASPWPQTELLGTMLPRDIALAHPVLREIFEVAEYVVAHDERISAFLALIR